MKKKNIILFSLGVLYILLLIATWYYLEENDFSNDKETIFLEKYNEMISKSSEPYIIEELLNENIGKLSKEGITNAVSGLMNSILNCQEDMSNKDGALQSVFKKEDTNNIDFNIPYNIDKVKDETLKGFLKDIKKKHYLVEKYKDTYYIKPDFKYIVDTYGKYVNEDLKIALEYTIRENMSNIFDENTSLFKFDIIVNKIIKGEEIESNYPDSPYINNVTAEKFHYYKMYFGTDELYNIYLTDNNGKVLDSVLENYKETIVRYPNSQLAKDLNLYIDKLKSTNNVITDNVKVWLIELTKVSTINIDN